MKITTLCYIENGSKTLMLHRNKKKNDENAGKWVGVGGHIENGESPEDCVIREVKEETGLEIDDIKFRGVITFVSDEYGTEYMFLFTAYSEKTELKECSEGDLRWVENDKLETLPMWEGDKVFLNLIKNNSPFFSLKLVYEKDRLVNTVLY